MKKVKKISGRRFGQQIGRLSWVENEITGLKIGEVLGDWVY